MRDITRAAVVAALVSLIVPQAAFGMTKPPAISHPDSVPIDSLTSATKSGAPEVSLSAAPASLISGGNAGTNSISFTSLTDGDIVVVTDPNYFTGHAGLFDRSHYSGILSYAMLSANVQPYNGVQYEKCAKYRLNDRAYALRVPQEFGHRIAVRDWASRQLGKPYSVLATKTDLSSFYCSKLAWAAYRYVSGVDLDADGGFWVWPIDLVNSRYTALIGYWS
jgi:cell wall-associated NlpC family hydrolase